MNPVIKYFSGEKAESYLFLLLGVMGLATSIYLIIANNTSVFWKGFLYPLILISILETIVGITLIYRSPKDIIRVENYFNNEPSKIKTLEIPRMEKVMRNFMVFRDTEIVLILAGIVMYFYFSGNDFLQGLGLGFTIQASIVLILDYYAESRGKIYLEFLKSIIND